MTSAAEAETAGLFYNCQTAIDIRNMLKALGHTQPATPVKTDNSTAESFVKNLIKQRRSKSWDVRYHWLSEKQNDNTFNIYWDRGNNNWSDYHSKHHSPMYHRNMRKYYILKGFLLKTLKNEQKLDTSLAARVCSYPTTRKLRTNKPAKQQRSKVTVNNIHKRESLIKLSS